MAARKKKKLPAMASEILNLIPRLKPMPDEDAGQMADLRQALLMDLAPSTPYEHSIAEQIFNLEWEASRHRRLRDALIVAEVRRQAEGAFYAGEVGPLGWSEEYSEAKLLSYDLVSDDHDRRMHALEKLGEQEVSPDEIMAISYRNISASLETHDRQIADIERRRRRLYNDFDKVKALRARPVEDAVLVDDR